MQQLTTCLAVTALLIFIHSAAVASQSAPPMNAAVAKKAASPDSPELAAFKKTTRAKYDLKEQALANHDAESILTKFYAPDVISVEGTGRRNLPRTRTDPCPL